MHIGKNILELRRKKNVTQEELAAELGVTAAAVSKWENGYTLPDILMLCALADYFEVTTDELLGRNPKAMYAVVAAKSPELGAEIQKIAKSYGFVTKQIFGSVKEALAAARADKTVTHLFASCDESEGEETTTDESDTIIFINVQAPNPQQILDGFEIYFQNMDAYNTIAKQSKKI